MRYIQAHNPCNLCGSSKAELHQAADEGFSVIRCNKCHLIYVDPQPDEEVLKKSYSFSYYEPWLLRQKKLRNKMWQKRLTRIKRMLPSGRLLDIGCGEGSFLELAEIAGYHATGTEYSEVAATIARGRLRHGNVFVGPLSELLLANNYFDIVTMWHVLEHVIDPKRYLKEIHSILKPDGLLVMAVPNVNDLVMQIAYRIIKRRKMKLFSKDEKEVHLYHFSAETIKAYLDKTGFECLRLSPDFGIVEDSKKLINMISAIPYYLAGIKIFNAIEIYAIPKRIADHQ